VTSYGAQVRTIRPVTLDDAPALAALYSANREFLAPWEPERDDDFFTVAGQQSDIRVALILRAQGTGLVHVIVDEAGAVVGRIALQAIIQGCFQSCSLGYWVSEAENGRGRATAAVRDALAVAFGDLGLHRVQAETLLHNTASQRVLERNGFQRIGTAPEYLRIAGRWQDHALFQIIAPA
jgi:ribosomal-protein-alanine N-acetyltransferase